MLKTNHHWLRAWVLLALLLGVNAQASSLCAGNENTAITATTPSADFSDNGDGTVTHHTTGLIWQRCSLGQSWDGADCTGTATAFTWQQALAAATQDALAGFSDWRLPNKNELASIVEHRCYGPAINDQLFPDLPSVPVYVSASAQVHNEGIAWSVSFNSGYVYYNLKDSLIHVRLVRAGQ
ncbi:hypothetical protein BOO92_11790 [Vibrio navarrensis]|uniref:Lcl C-terminal domain-containing protein n=1 Tax=Vibrio navarrensis TaxID=29495 RepID=UPI001868C14C|nr:DUF1566 domain-containing protein [Vibrio navarrensis]MBE3657355.1 hypothetical protein [Vibrio navarrensis]